MSVIVKGGGGKPEEEKTVTAGTSVIEVNPSSGKVMKKVTVNPTPTESKSVTPTTSELTITPSEGKHLSQVVVGAVEDVTPEVTAQTPVITQIAENLGVTITTPSGTNKQILQGNNANLLNIKNNAKKEGAYLWKKFEVISVSFSALTGGNPHTVKAYSNDVDLSTVDSSFFAGMSGEWASGVVTNGEYKFISSTQIRYTYDPNQSFTFNFTYEPQTQVLTINGDAGLYTFGSYTKYFLIDYVVDNDPTAYPDGGMQGGYYYELYGKPLKIVTWSGGTDEEIVAMVEAADKGEINLSDYWAVGDTRTVQLSAMEATGVGESHSAQEVDLVLMHAGGYELADGTTCNFVVGQKDSLAEKGHMNSVQTNNGSWGVSARRAWCNSIYKNALPSTLLPIFKQFKTITAQTYSGSTNQGSVDYFALPAAKEVFGGSATSAGSATSLSNLTEFNALFQFDWYKTASNRIKRLGKTGRADIWWERSPYYGSSTHFCDVYGGGNASYDNASGAYGLAPFGCI